MTARSLGTVMGALVQSHIQVAVITSLPKSIDVHIGDERRGPVAQKSFKPSEFDLIYPWLIEQGNKHYPKSAFASIDWLDG